LKLIDQYKERKEKIYIDKYFCYMHAPLQSLIIRGGYYLYNYLETKRLLMMMKSD